MIAFEKRRVDPAPFCPHCGALLSGVSTDTSEGPVPRPASGDITICSYCCTILEFRDAAGRLDLIEVTDQQRAEILADPRCWFVHEIMKQGPRPPPPGTRRQ